MRRIFRDNISLGFNFKTAYAGNVQASNIEPTTTTKKNMYIDTLRSVTIILASISTPVINCLTRVEVLSVVLA